MTLTPKNWKSFQHYKDRSPAWIKLHKGLLDDFAYSRLPLASRALAPMLWLLASEYEEGAITASLEEIAYRLHISEKDLTDALTPLIDSGFFLASETLAEPEQPAIPEREDIGKRNIEKIDAEADASGAAAPLDPAVPEREYFLRGRVVLGEGAGALIAKLLKSKGGNVALARAAIEQASQKQKPAEYIGAIIRGPPMVRPQTAHQQERQTGREILDDIGEFISRSGSEDNPGILRHDPGDGPKSLRGRSGGDLVELSAASPRSRG